MRHLSALAAIFGCALLSGCSSPTLFHKEGADPAMSERTLLKCEVAALKDVPPDIRRRFVPAEYVPFRSCNASGNCFTRYRMIQPPRTETYDLNQDLRTRLTQQCMAEAGYRPVRLPLCDPETVRALAGKLTASQPPLGAGSCAVRLKSGQWRIVTPPS